MGEVKTADALLELVERCEKASGSDRELDCDIADAIPNGPIMPLPPDPRCWVYRGDNLGGAIVAASGRAYSTNDRYIPRFTASLDAAMSLVPEGAWLANLQENGSARDRAWAQVDIEISNAWMTSEGRAATPALALCAAALRAVLAASVDTHAERQDQDGLGPKDAPNHSRNHL